MNEHKETLVLTLYYINDNEVETGDLLGWLCDQKKKKKTVLLYMPLE